MPIYPLSGVYKHSIIILGRNFPQLLLKNLCLISMPSEYLQWSKPIKAMYGGNSPGLKMNLLRCAKSQLQARYQKRQPLQRSVLHSVSQSQFCYLCYSSNPSCPSKSQLYLNHISAISQPYLSHISNISQTYLSHISSNYACMQLCNNASIYKYESLQVCKCASMHKYASL